MVGNHIIYSPIKINITLRVFGKNENGYHDLYSVFWQKNSREKLTISEAERAERDLLAVRGALIQGENLITKVLKLARAEGAVIPPLDITLDKVFPTGSGIGAGSGNAAALIKWLKNQYGFSIPHIERLGADVAFLASDYTAASACGIGEILTECREVPDLVWLLVFPEWRSGTKEAYGALDKMRKKILCSKELAQKEADVIISKLCRKEFCGMLPNDFYPLLEMLHPEYNELCRTSEETDSLAWGLCGSGSAFFALYKDLASAYCGERILKNKFNNAEIGVII